MEDSIFPGSGLRRCENFDSDPQRDIATNSRHKDTFPSERILRRRNMNQPVRTQERTIKENERNTIPKWSNNFYIIAVMKKTKNLTDIYVKNDFFTIKWPLFEIFPTILKNMTPFWNIGPRLKHYLCQKRLFYKKMTPFWNIPYHFKKHDPFLKYWAAFETFTFKKTPFWNFPFILIQSEKKCIPKIYGTLLAVSYYVLFVPTWFCPA